MICIHNINGLQIAQNPFRIHAMRFYTYLIMILMASAAQFANAAERTVSPATNDNTQTGAGIQQDNHWSATAQEILLSALSLTGTQYKYGGKNPDTGFDCSGFVRYVFQQAANLTLPHNARAISQLGQVVPLEDLQPGDLVFFNTLKSAFSHVGIYLGNNRFIHAPSSGGGINVGDMTDSYWSKRFNGARRVEGGEPSAATKDAELKLQ